MNKEQTKKLQTAFPEFFIDLYGDPKETSLWAGIECQDGWYDLIYQLCEDIKKANPQGFKWTQIKEKFGSLRAYCVGGNDTVYELIDKAEQRSSEICEVCGHDGDNAKSETGWYRSRCSDHRHVKWVNSHDDIKGDLFQKET